MFCISPIRRRFSQDAAAIFVVAIEPISDLAYNCVKTIKLFENSMSSSCISDGNAGAGSRWLEPGKSQCASTRRILNLENSNKEPYLKNRTLHYSELA